MEGASYTAAALPGIVVALGLVTISLALVPSMYQTFATLLLAYLVLFLPRALAGLRTGFAQVPPELEWVAASLGIRPGTVFRKITLRLAAPSLAAAAALVFLAIVNELTATLLLAPIGTRTLATQFWALTGELDYAAAAPFAAVMIALSLPLSALLYWQSFRAAGR
jgi:iron(III) transport system permease protein